MISRITAMEVSRLRLLLRPREAPVRVTDRSVLRDIEPIIRAARERKETWIFIAQAVETAGIRKQNGKPFRDVDLRVFYGHAKNPPKRRSRSRKTGVDQNNRDGAPVRSSGTVVRDSQPPAVGTGGAAVPAVMDAETPARRVIRRQKAGLDAVPPRPPQKGVKIGDL